MGGRAWREWVSGKRRVTFALLAVLAGAAAGADAPTPRTCCDATPAWTVGIEAGVAWANTEEIVEARPAHAAQYLRRLSWDALVGVGGIELSYRAPGRLRMTGGVQYLADAGGGVLVNLDYLDATSDAVTHRSVSPAGLLGVGWELAVDVMLVEEIRGTRFARSFARVAYRGAYHAWGASGGRYEYPDRQGRFADDEELVRYLVLHQVFEAGVFVEVGQVRGGLYGRLGGAVSFLPLVDDRDTHVLTGTEYYNTYRRGWHVRPEIAMGVRLAGGPAVDPGTTDWSAPPTWRGAGSGCWCWKRRRCLAGWPPGGNFIRAFGSPWPIRKAISPPKWPGI